MDVRQVCRYYFDKMAKDVAGLKIMLVDDETVRTALCQNHCCQS